MNDRTSLSLVPEQLIAAYRERRFDDLSRQFLEILEHFSTYRYHSFDIAAQHFLNVFVKHFLHLFTQEDYLPSEADMARFIELNLVIGDIVAASSFRTTDPYVEILKGQQRNFAKLLALYSARNRAPLDRHMLFNTEPRFATQWYFCFWENYKSCCASEDALRHLREHLRFRDGRMGAINKYVHHAYFGCTYADCENDRELKRHINAIFQQWEPSRTPIVNRPNRRRLVVITSMWFPHQSVYRCTHSFVKALAAEFDLTLVHLGPARGDIDTSLFRDVRRFWMRLPIDLSALTPNDWAIAYYPDIGMNIESIFLSNLRLAPIQICGYGHPVSTFGSRIDYWLGGRDIESIEDHERNYSERLVLVPGSGVAPNRPDYTPQGLYAPGEVLLVNCAWTSQKINYPLLERLAGILRHSRRRLRFRIFTGGSLSGNSYVPLKRDIAQVLGEANVEVLDGLPYREYMRQLEQGDFCLDSYPFGGYATATDALYLRKPMITQEGTNFYNRSAASLLRRVGLEELIVHDGAAYKSLALRLIHDHAYRAGLQARLAAVDLEQALFAHDDARYVVKAFRYLLENHERLQRDGHRQPILVEA
jgi:hypothetical protein